MKHFLSIFIAAILSFTMAWVWADEKSDALSRPAKKEQTPSQISSIQGGKTTKSEVQALCGKPVILKNTAGGEEWSYSYGETRSLEVHFDKAGIVSDYVYKDSAPLPKQGQQANALAGEKPGTVHCDLCPVYCTRTVCTLNGCQDEQYICQWYSCNCGGF